MNGIEKVGLLGPAIVGIAKAKVEAEHDALTVFDVTSVYVTLKVVR